eukprot:m.75912 g.75912  ORF g.75912 m.75912 type:complete len:752 (-) comp12530_c0_seq1:113-2368(-)
MMIAKGMLCVFALLLVETRTTNGACSIVAIPNTANALVSAGTAILTWLECATAPNNMQKALGSTKYNQVLNKLRLSLVGGPPLQRSDFDLSGWIAFSATLAKYTQVKTVTGSITIDCNGDNSINDNIVKLYSRNILLQPLTVDNHLTVKNCHALSDLTGLSLIKTVKKNVVFTGNNALKSSTGFTANGASTLTITNHPLLEDLKGFAAMTTPTKITINNNHRLIDGCDMQSVDYWELVASSTVTNNGQNVVGTKKWPLLLTEQTSIFSNNGVVAMCPWDTTTSTTKTVTTTTKTTATTTTKTTVTTTTKTTNTVTTITETDTTTKTVTTITNTGVTTTKTTITDTSITDTTITATSITTITGTTNTDTTVTATTVTATTITTIESTIDPSPLNTNPTLPGSGTGGPGSGGVSLPTTTDAPTTNNPTPTTIKITIPGLIQVQNVKDDEKKVNDDSSESNNSAAVIAPIIAVVVILLVCVFLAIAWKRNRDEKEDPEGDRIGMGNFTLQEKPVFNPHFNKGEVVYGTEQSQHDYIAPSLKKMQQVEYSEMGEDYLNPTLRKGDSNGEYSAVDYRNMDKNDEYATPFAKQKGGSVRSIQIAYDSADAETNVDVIYTAADGEAETTYDTATNRDTSATYAVATGKRKAAKQNAALQPEYAVASVESEYAAQPVYDAAASAGSESQPQYDTATSIGTWAEAAEYQPQYDTASSTLRRDDELQQQLYSVASSGHVAEELYAAETLRKDDVLPAVVEY